MAKSKKNHKAESVRTTYHRGSDQYGRVRPNSRIIRYYGVTVAGEILFRDGYLTKRGADLAAALINDGMDLDTLNKVNVDDIAASAFHARNNYVDGAKPTIHWMEAAKIVALR